MDIKGKLRNKKIERFIKKNKNVLNFTDQEWAMLYSITCESFLNKLDKLSPKKKEYVLQPLKYTQKEFREKYGIKEITLDELLTLIKDQLEVANSKNFDIKQAPDLAKLFIAMENKSDASYPYAYMLCRYMDPLNTKEERENINSHIKVFTDYFKEWKELLKEQALFHKECEKIMNLSAYKLKSFISYHVEEDQFSNKQQAFNSFLYLEEKDQEKINGLMNFQFEKLLKYIVNDSKTPTRYSIKLQLTTIDDRLYDYSLDERKLEILKNLPHYLTNYLSHHIPENEETLKNLYSEDSEQLIDEIRKTPDIHSEAVITILMCPEFIELPVEQQTLILKKLRKVGEKEETNIDRYERKVEFLIGNGEEGFLTILPDERYLMKTLDFICKEENISVLFEKLNALEMISGELIKDNKHLELYDKYIEFISKGLENKKPVEQQRILNARSSYFEENYFSDIMEKIENSTKKESIEKLLYSNQTEEQMEQVYQFIEVIEEYPDETISTIVNHFINSQNIENTKKILEFIKGEKFKKLHPILQQEYLARYPLAKDKKIVAEESLELDIPDYMYVTGEVQKHGGEMTFINKETGIKVMIKTRNSRKN